jgi:hypothetical protein
MIVEGHSDRCALSSADITGKISYIFRDFHLSSTNIERENDYARFEVFTVVKIQVEDFWVVTTRNVMVGY